ncbi:MAG: hypothetical protein CSA54_00250 [Gammaproteobacteria bacterium]|nr:MAG: hypothetical protein CSA54_00250 [Gammaproteobacteria bacterium]
MKLAVFVLLVLLSGCATPQVKVTLAPAQGKRAHAGECVVLLHGLARSSASMRKLQAAFVQAGYRSVNIDYPSTRFASAALLAQYIQPAIQRHCAPQQYRLHFVGHSMGGVLSRLYVQQHRPPQLGRLVTIASPHRGSELVDKLAWLPPFAWINGAAGYEMGTGKQALAARLSAVDYPLLSIVGTRTTNPLYSALIPGRDDGKVSVQSACLQGSQCLYFPYGHTFIMRKPDVIAAALGFVNESVLDYPHSASD